MHDLLQKVSYSYIYSQLAWACVHITYIILLDTTMCAFCCSVK